MPSGRSPRRRTRRSPTAVGAATGIDGAYQVRWSDAADIGSPGFGLLNELERQGLDVAADEFFHVPVTDHRVRPRERADAQVHLATGGYVDRWRQVPGAVEVATYEPRTAPEIARADELRRPADRPARASRGSTTSPSRSTPTCSGRHSTRASRRRTSPTSPSCSTSASRWPCSSPHLTPMRELAQNTAGCGR